jgi:enoyl-CoA hydratase/carnithine racemase
MSERGAIRYEVDGHVATITIDRPEKRNAMDWDVLADFHDAVERAGSDDDARVVIVTGAGGAFCAGTDLAALAGTPPTERATRGAAGRPRVAWPLAACPKPVVAAVDGPAVGMGAEFATQADVRIASTAARFAWNFVRRGLVADTGAGTFLLPRIIGPTEALRLLCSGDFLDAEGALRLGFVSAVVEPGDLPAAARAEAERYLAGSPFAVRRTKRLVYQAMAGEAASHDARTAAALRECFASDDHREGVASFLERRAPRFTGT